MKILSEIIKWFAIILFIVVAFVCIHFLVGKLVFKNEYPTIFGYSYASVKEKTYDGKYQLGDLVIIKKQEKYEKGDYILYTKNQKTKIELISEIKETSYITVGNDPSKTSEIHTSYIHAKVVGPLASMGKFSAFITSTIGIFVVLVCFAMFMFTQM